LKLAGRYFVLIKIDEDQIINKIIKIKPKSILFTCPDGCLNIIQEFASRIEEKFNVQTIISADPCYGRCDTSELDISRIGADIAFHIGHNSSQNQIGQNIFMINIFDDISFKNSIIKSLDKLRNYKRIGLCTISQHLQNLNSIKILLESEGFEVHIGKGQNSFLDGQIFGCQFQTVFKIRNNIDALLFLGQSRFHSIGAALASNIPTFIVDPYLVKIVSISDYSEKWKRRSILQICKAAEAENFGVIIGLRSRQLMPKKTFQIGKRLADLGKKVQILTLREITEDRLAIFRDIDAFIQTACPRISLDGVTYSRPVLSIPQTEALFDLWKGIMPEDYLEKPHWL
jgi:2-(3-amino-3-carboxypropyl)histidine synthase